MREMLSSQFNVSIDSITEDTSFKDDLGADSLDLFEFVLAIEEQFDIELPSEELTELYTVGDFLAYLRGKGIEI